MSEVVTKTLLGRKNLFQVVVIASLIGLGVNLLSAWFSDFVGNLTWVKWVTGVLLIILGCLLFVRFLLQERTVNKEIQGVLLLDRSKKELLEIDDYDLSENLHRALHATFLENAALRVGWESEPMFRRREKTIPPAPDTDAQKRKEHEDDKKVSYMSIVRMEMDPQDRPVSEKSILIEAIEFCMLEILSNHLSEYFGAFGDEDKRVRTLTRGDIPHILLENRVLSILTTPVEDRQIFVNAGIGKPPPKGEVHTIFGSDGSVYERFDLKVPTGTSLLRPNPGHVQLKHRRFTLDLVTAFEGFTRNLPRYFDTLYVGEPDTDIDARQIEFEIRAQLHPSALICLRGWEYYRWLDSFVRYFENHVSFNAFLERIQWTSTAGHIRATLVREHLKNRKKPQQDAAPNSRPPSQLSASTEGQSSDSQPTPSAGGCG